LRAAALSGYFAAMAEKRAPGGSKSGERRGGRQRGARNKATIEREQKALAELANRAKAMVAAGKPLTLAKDELAGIIPMVKDTVGLFQKAAMVDEAGTGAPGQKGFDAAKWRDFKDWLEFFATVCHRAADFQSPKYRAIAVAVNPDPAPAEKDPRVIEHLPEDEHDRERVANNAYLRLVKG